MDDVTGYHIYSRGFIDTSKLEGSAHAVLN